jgi:hypothetical protein
MKNEKFLFSPFYIQLRRALELIYITKYNILLQKVKKI